MEDRRAVRTKKAIREAFLTLLEKKPVNKITVSEISELADLGRGTFYLHYSDPYDLLEQIEDDLITQINQTIQTYFAENTKAELAGYLEQMTNFAYENRRLYKLLMGESGNLQFQEKIKGTFADYIITSEVQRDEYENTKKRYYATFVISGMTGLMMDWIRAEKPMPPNQFAEVIRYAIDRTGQA